MSAARPGGTELTVGTVLARGLRVLGITGMYGADLPGVPVGGPALGAVSARAARVLALAHRNVLAGDAAIHRGGGHIQVHGDPGPGGGPGRGAGSGPIELTDPTGTIEVLVELDRRLGRGDGAELTVAIDPATPVIGGSGPASARSVDRWTEPPADAHRLLATARHAVILAGPGVPRASALPGLHALAASGSLGVLNTFGAKGIFDWRSRHHLATVGLQARDLELGGLAAADLVLTTGLDRAETPPLPDGCGTMPVDPGALGPLAERHGVPRRAIAVPPLRPALARVTQEGWAATSAPLPPSLVTRAYSAVTAGRGFVAADPGVAGYWVARTFPTSALGEAKVPAQAWATGFATACALLGGLTRPGAPILAVTDGLDGAVTLELLDVAGRVGVPLSLEAWSDDGEDLGPDAYRERLRLLVGTGGTVSIATDPSQMARMEDVAGPCTAWQEVT